MDLQEVGCVGYGLDRAGSGQGQVVGICEYGNEPSGSLKYGEFLDQLKTGQLRKKGSAPWSSKYIFSLHAYYTGSTEGTKEHAVISICHKFKQGHSLLK